LLQHLNLKQLLVATYMYISTMIAAVAYSTAAAAIATAAASSNAAALDVSAVKGHATRATL
jgi:hypothetical protein